jgi:hypothetical protein
MNALQIDVPADGTAAIDDPQRIAIRSDTLVLTRLQRLGEEHSDDYLVAPPAQLAFWLAENWWRLRWECVPSDGITPEWRLAHELSSIGGGYAWPQAAMWGEGERVGLFSRSDPPGVIGPVRFLTKGLEFIPATTFEEAVDRFLATACDNHAGFGSDRPALRSLVTTLKAERADPAIDAWRRVEAKLGFDPDDAPDPLMSAIAALIDRYSGDGVEEAALAAQGIAAPAILQRAIGAAKDSKWVCNFSDALKAVGTFRHVPTAAPWVSAEAAARSVRSVLGIGSRPLLNRSLADLLKVRKEAFHLTAPLSGENLAYGLRLRIKAKKRDVVALRSSSSWDRRFEMSRALADAIWAKTDRLGPLADSKTARQKFQRAFAQSLLCPFDGLREYLKTSRPADEDITAAAQYFHVSERVVWTVLVNKHIIPRDRLEDMIEAE